MLYYNVTFKVCANEKARIKKRGKIFKTKVLEVMHQHTKPPSAYDILGKLRETNAKIVTPAVYQALTALVEHRSTHRLESLNPYIVCQRASHQNAFILSICNDRGSVEKKVAPDLLSKLLPLFKPIGFAARRHLAKARGICSSCETGQVLQ